MNKNNIENMRDIYLVCVVMTLMLAFTTHPGYMILSCVFVVLTQNKAQEVIDAKGGPEEEHF